MIHLTRSYVNSLVLDIKGGALCIKYPIQEAAVTTYNNAIHAGNVFRHFRIDQTIIHVQTKILWVSHLATGSFLDVFLVTCSSSLTFAMYIMLSLGLCVLPQKIAQSRYILYMLYHILSISTEIEAHCYCRYFSMHHLPQHYYTIDLQATWELLLGQYLITKWNSCKLTKETMRQEKILLLTLNNH